MASPARVYRESTEIEGQTGITKKHGSQHRALSVCLMYVCVCMAVFPTEPRERLGDRDWPADVVRGSSSEAGEKRRRGEEEKRRRRDRDRPV